MAAMSASILAAKAETGRHHVVAVRPLYGGTDHLLASGLLGVEVTLRPRRDRLRREAGHLPGRPRDAGQPHTRAGRHPRCRRRRGRPAGPRRQHLRHPGAQHPARPGAALSLHSATKYLGGHGDTVGGVVAGDAARPAALRRVRAVTGALLHPLGAYLLHRGLSDPARARTRPAGGRRRSPPGCHPPRRGPGAFYPRSAECDPLGLVGRQMRGPGAMLALELTGGYDDAARVTSKVRLFTHAVSLGGVDSLIQHPAALTHRPVAPDAALPPTSSGSRSASRTSPTFTATWTRRWPGAAEPNRARQSWAILGHAEVRVGRRLSRLLARRAEGGVGGDRAAGAGGGARCGAGNSLRHADLEVDGASFVHAAAWKQHVSLYPVPPVGDRALDADLAP